MSENVNHGDDRLRSQIAALLAGGLVTQTEPYPETDREFRRLQDELAALPDGDLCGKLVVSGFIATPYGPDQMRCQECTYYLVNRRWCDLPELAVPVEAQWWCRLWRV